MEPIKELKDLNLLDRFLFAEASEDPEIMRPVLEIILGKEIVLKHLPQAEKEVRKAIWSKVIRMDVLAVDVSDDLYEMEVQKRNTGNIPRRSRAYNGIIDSKLMEPGNVDYNTLNDVYIIIVMPFDLFGEGRYMYTFRMMCEEVTGLHLKDGATRIFLNTRGTNPEGVSEELIELLHYFENSNENTVRHMTSDKIRTIHKKVQKIKSNEKVGIRFMNAWEEKILDRQDAYEEGHKKGFDEGVCAIAKNLKEAGLSIKVIAQNTGLSEEDIENL